MLIWIAAGVLLTVVHRKPSSAPPRPPPAPPPRLPSTPAKPKPKATPKPRPAGTPAGHWVRVALNVPVLALEPGTYAGVFQLEGLEALFGDGDNIESELRKAMQWDALQVSSAPAIVPAAVPISRERRGERYWALGELAAADADEPPPQLRELWRFVP